MPALPDNAVPQSSSVQKENNIDIRESMRVLPVWIQPFLTELTGKALSGEAPWPHWGVTGRLVSTLFVFVASIASSMVAIQMGGWTWLLLPFTWLLTVSSTRTFQTALVHHASHGTLFRKRVWNDLAGEFLSLLAWIQPLALYRLDHVGHHAKTATSLDPDLKFLADVAGLKPGLKRHEYWRSFWQTLFSPRFHAAFALARLRANLVEPSWGRRAASMLWAGAILGATALTGGWATLVLAYLVPVGLLTQMSAWAGLLGLHQWVRLGHGTASKLEELGSVTSGRFLGEAAPEPKLKGQERIRAWARWMIRMLTVHLAARLAIVPGDLPNHDHHHWHPSANDWANPAYARRDAIIRDAGKLPPYTEFWGVRAAMEETFRRLGELSPNAQLGDPLTHQARQTVLLGM